MSRKKEIHWLTRQLPLWVERGLISTEQADGIARTYEEEADGPDRPGAGLIAGILGALLIGGGIILIVAYNWDDLSRTGRTIVSFAPLLLGQLIYGYAFFRQRASAGWTEGSATFLMLTLASCLALVSQTYHISGRPDEFLWTWLWLSLPLIYLRPASLPAILFLIGSCAWAFQAPFPTRPWFYLLVAAVLPHLYWSFRPQSEKARRQVMGWTVVLAAFPAWLAVTPSQLPEYGLLGTALLSALFFLGSPLLYDPALPVWRRPWRMAGGIGAFILLLIVTYDLWLPSFDPEGLVYGSPRLPHSTGLIHFGLLLGLGVLYLYLLIRNAAERRASEWIPGLLPLLLLAYLLLDRTAGSHTALVLANLTLLVWGAANLQEGLERKSMPAVNRGMFLILALATARFFDTEWSPLTKGIAFVLLGLAFLGARYWLERRLKKN